MVEVGELQRLHVLPHPEAPTPAGALMRETERETDARD
jgi:hypothetical protein